MRIAFFSVALLASTATLAATPLEGWYAGVSGGYTYMPDNISTSRYGFKRTDASYSSGFNAGANIGFKSNPLRYEAELTYIQADLRKFFINKIRQSYVDGETNATLAMAKIYYDFPDMVPCVQPFLGAGLGYAYVETNIRSKLPFGYTHYVGSDSVFAYQGTAGLNYNYAEAFTLSIAYRYVGTERVNALGKIFQVNMATAGVVYRFDDGKYQ